MPIKIYIPKQEKTRIANIFKMLSAEDCQCYISENGIDFHNNHCEGQISKNVFIDWQVQGKKRLTIIDKPKELKRWIDNWKVCEELKPCGMNRMVNQVIEIGL